MNSRHVGWVVVGLAVFLSACSARRSDDGETSETTQESTDPTGAERPGDASAPAATAASLTLEGFLEHDRDDDKSDRSSFFSFAKGTLLPNSQIIEAQQELEKSGRDSEIEARFRDAYDIFFDADHGIATNSEIPGWELGFGNGGIVDMGQIGIDEVTEAPENGYAATLDTSEILAGHTYCVRTANGREYGKIHILTFDRDDMTLDFTWSFQAGGSRQFE